jgi:hypothetical protein
VEAPHPQAGLGDRLYSARCGQSGIGRNAPWLTSRNCVIRING